jgi:molybdopterin molybdotransferase
MSEPTLLPVEDALERILEQAVPLPALELPLARTLGRYLAEPLIAAFELPPFTNSAMDGYALRHRDTPGQLEVVGESAAGKPFTGAIAPGQAVTISTGAVLPDGADAVVPIEWIESESHGLIEVPRAVAGGYSVRSAGSDVTRGAEVLPAGTRIGPAQVGAAASLGRSTLRCGASPRVAVVTTGTELRKPGEQLGPGDIYDSNGPLLAAALADAGADATIVPTAADTHAAHHDALAEALTHDVVISTGGVSVGGHDLVREVERDLGVHELFWRIAMKPGKPLSFGISERPQPAGRTLVFGIPGNPVSVLVCFEMFVRPALAALQGARAPRPAFARAILDTEVQRNPERDEMIRVRELAGGRVEPLRPQQSHQLAASAQATGLARIPAGAGALAAGSAVEYLPLN